MSTTLLPPAATLHAAEVEVTREVLFTQGGLVPVAGVFGSGIPQGALWTGFGTPAINIASEFGLSSETAFLGRWAADGKKETGIFVRNVTGSSTRLRVKSGEELPGVGRFASFRDPQIAADGGVLFFATVQGPAVTSANSTVVCYSAGPDNDPELIARVGVPVPGHRDILGTIGSAALASGGTLPCAGSWRMGGRRPMQTIKSRLPGRPARPCWITRCAKENRLRGLAR